jgi:signal transduction histidine kinase
VLETLLEHACHHALSFGTVRASVEESDEGVMVRLEDDGPGMSAELVPRLFQHGGLGLYYCRISAESWGGAIGYESREPTGSTLWLRLPSAPRTSGIQECSGEYGSIALAG